MPIYEWKGFSAKKAKFMDGTIRAKDSREAMDNVLLKRLGGSGEVTVWKKKNGKTKTG